MLAFALIAAMQVYETDAPALAEVRDTSKPSDLRDERVGYQPVQVARRPTPMERYRSGTAALMAGAGGSLGSTGAISGLFANRTAQGTVALGIEGRGVLAGGIMLGARAFVVYPTADSRVSLGIGASFGYVAPLSGTVGIMPYIDAPITVQTSSPAVLLVYPAFGVGVPILLGDHGFIEPFTSIGAAAAITSGAGDAAAMLTIGYRLGVIL